MENKIYSAVNLMIKTSRMHKHIIDSSVSGIGMHTTHHRILMHIAKNGRLDSQKALADYIGVSTAAITGALKKLETDGYIKRTQGTDNRYNEIEITEKGREIVTKTRKLFSAVDKAIFSNFTEEEIDMYIECLQKIHSNITCIDEDRRKEGSAK